MGTALTVSLVYRLLGVSTMSDTLGRELPTVTLATAEAVAPLSSVAVAVQVRVSPLP